MPETPDEVGHPVQPPAEPEPSGPSVKRLLREALGRGGPRTPLAEVGDDPDPRFTLANERTFLAWNRTALAMLAAGLAVAHLLPPFGFPGARTGISVALLGLGAASALLSYPQWEDRERALRQGHNLPATGMARFLAMWIALITIVAAIATVVESG